MLAPALAAISSGLIFVAAAAACDMRFVEEAQSRLRQAASDAELATARAHAREASTWLERCASAAVACGCVVPAEDFAVAASQAGGAAREHTFGDFVAALHRATRMFNDAVTKLRACSARIE
jgi:hypothetical protein